MNHYFDINRLAGFGGEAESGRSDNRVPAERELMRKFFGDMKADQAVALGWYSTQRSGITTASEFGNGTLPADFYLNSSARTKDRTVR